MSNYPNVVKGLLYKKNYSVTKHIYYSGQYKTYGHPLCVFFKDGDAEDTQFPFTTEKRSDQSAIDSSKALFLSEEDADKWPEGDYAFLSKEEITAVRIDIDSKTPVYVNIRWVQGYLNRKEETKINPIIIERLKEIPQPNPFTTVQQAKLDAKKDVKKEFIKWFKTLYPEAVSGEDWVALTIKDLAPQSHIKSKTRSDCEIWFKLLSNKVKVIIADDLYITKPELFLSDEAFDKIQEISKNKYHERLEDALGNQTTTIAWNIYGGENTLYMYDSGWSHNYGYININIGLSNINNKQNRKIRYYFSSGIDGVTYTFNQATSELPKLIDKLKDILQNDFKSESFKKFETKLKAFNVTTLEDKIHLYRKDLTDRSISKAASLSSIKKEDIRKFTDYLLDNYKAELSADDLNPVLKDLEEKRGQIEYKLKLDSLSFSFLYCYFKEFDIDLFDYDITPWVGMLSWDCSPKEGYWVLPKKLVDKYPEIYIRVSGGSGLWTYSPKSFKIYIEEGIKTLDNVTFSTQDNGTIYLYLPDSLEFFDLLTLDDPDDIYCFFNPVKDEDGKLMSNFTVNKWEFKDKEYRFAINKKGK